MRNLIGHLAPESVDLKKGRSYDDRLLADLVNTSRVLMIGLQLPILLSIQSI